MSGYLINFIVYTTAMIGVIFLAVLVYKKFSCNFVSKSQFLNVEDCISLAPRKNLYVVRAGKERFLVASDAERTSLIAKLADGETQTTSVEELPSIVNIHKAKRADEVFKNLVNIGKNNGYNN